VRRLPIALALLALAPAPAAAQTGGAGPGLTGTGTGGVAVGQPVRAHFSARLLALTPASAAPGETLTVSYRIDGTRRRARVKLKVVPRGGGAPIAKLDLGRRRTGRAHTARWAPRLDPGRYTVRLRGARAAFEVVAPPPAPSAIFPVQGAWSFGDAGARFGAPRKGHSHQGQDVLAAEGTPLVSPVAGTVSWVAYQAAGAGHYVVIHGADGRDHVFMHLQDGSVLVAEGQAVAAGQRIGSVGSTGASTGPHLHFEIWPDGWWAEGSEPIDPLPDLQAWAGA
jgi:murein DD-endopeptidase MepM/ murein hydrolase activator NlpD